MKRDLQALTSAEFDVIVVGGGVYGICVARDAALRGLRVALIEKGDFAAGGASNTFNMVHGGIRSLQQLDLARVRQLAEERSTLLRMAPHLIRPLPIAIPTYGRGRDGKAALRAGFGLYDLLTRGRNRGIDDPSRRLPPARTIGRDETLELFPGLVRKRLTGAAVFSDAQMHSPSRLALAMLRSAVDAGAVVANWLEVTGFIRKGIQVIGVGVRDTASGDAFLVHGKIVLNAAGAWAERILEEGLGATISPPSQFSRDVCLIVDRLPEHRMGLAVLDETRRSPSLLHRSHRHLLMLPWQNQMLVGVWQKVHPGLPETTAVSEDEVRSYLAQLNTSYPGFRVDMREVLRKEAGLTLVGRAAEDNKPEWYGGRSRFVDHSATHGIHGILSLVGVRWTTARADAARVVDELVERLDLSAGVDVAQCSTNSTPVQGGDFSHFDSLVQDVHDAVLPSGLGMTHARALARNYGTAFRDVLDYTQADPTMAGTLAGTTVTRAEVAYAAGCEMAQTLADVVFRRTSLGLGRHPGMPALEEAAVLIGREHGWSSERVKREVADVSSRFTGAPKTAPAPQRSHASV